MTQSFLDNFVLFTQQKDLDLQIHCKIPISEITGWNIDAFQNVIVAEKSTISKYTSEGKISYQISIKSFGEIKQIMDLFKY